VQENNLKETGMIKAAHYVFLIFLLTAIAPPITAGAAALDGTMWMFEHESGSRHYVAFYGNYHYLNSSGPGDYRESLWLRSTFPYFSHENLDGSITYCSTHVASAAWAINWGRFDIGAGSGSFNAAGMLCSIFIYNRNEPYQLVSPNWHPPAVPAGLDLSADSVFIPELLSNLFGQ
jgi:hypothetical protein